MQRRFLVGTLIALALTLGASELTQAANWITPDFPSGKEPQYEPVQLYWFEVKPTPYAYRKTVHVRDGLKWAAAVARSSGYFYLFVDGRPVFHFAPREREKPDPSATFRIDLTAALTPGPHAIVISAPREGFALDGVLQYAKEAVPLATDSSWQVMKFPPTVILEDEAWLQPTFNGSGAPVNAGATFDAQSHAKTGPMEEFGPPSPSPQPSPSGRGSHARRAYVSPKPFASSEFVADSSLSSGEKARVRGKQTPHLTERTTLTKSSAGTTLESIANEGLARRTLVQYDDTFWQLGLLAHEGIVIRDGRAYGWGGAVRANSMVNDKANALYLRTIKLGSRIDKLRVGTALIPTSELTALVRDVQEASRETDVRSLQQFLLDEAKALSLAEKAILAKSSNRLPTERAIIGARDQQQLASISRRLSSIRAELEKKWGSSINVLNESRHDRLGWLPHPELVDSQIGSWGLRFNPITAPTLIKADGRGWLFNTDPNDTGESEKRETVGYNIENQWPKMTVPRAWNAVEAFKNYRGVAWYRTRINVPAEWQGHDVVLRFEANDSDKVWVNDVPVGSTAKPGARSYTIGRSVIRPGAENVLAFKVSGAGAQRGLVGSVTLACPELEGLKPDAPTARVLATPLSPCVMLSADSTTLEIQGWAERKQPGPREILLPSAKADSWIRLSGERSYQLKQDGKLAANWAMLWMTPREENSPDRPVMLVFEKQPLSISNDGTAVRITFSKPGARVVAVRPWIKQIPEPGSPQFKDAVSFWQRAALAIPVNYLSLTKTIAPGPSTNFPFSITNVSPGPIREHTLTYDYASLQDEWGTKPLQIAPMPALGSYAMDENFRDFTGGLSGTGHTLVIGSRLPPHPNPLPRGEGTTRTALRQTQSPRRVESRRTILPLPRGEGQGEGERNATTAKTSTPSSEPNVAKTIQDGGLLAPYRALLDTDCITYSYPIEPFPRFVGFTSWMFAGSDTGVRGNQREIELIKSTGANSYRPQHNFNAEKSPHFPNDPRTRVQIMADVCNAAGMNYMNNIDQTLGARREFVQTNYVAFMDRVNKHYESIARQLHGRSFFDVAYDLINEPFDHKHDAYNKAIKELTARVRAIDPVHLLYVEPCEAWGAIEQLKLIEPTGDPLTVYSFHDYNFRLFKPSDRWPTEERDISNICRQWTEAFKFAIRHGAAMHCGEFGGFDNSTDNELAQLTLLNDFFRIFDQFDMQFHYYSGRSVFDRRQDGSMALSNVIRAYRDYLKPK